MSILETDFNNSLSDFITGPVSTGFENNKRKSTWASNLVGNRIAIENDPPPFEWTPVLNPTNEFEDPIVGISGTAVVLGDGLSKGDVPFTHPFGFDWVFFIAPDPPYERLLAPSNQGQIGTDSFNGDNEEYIEAVFHARFGQTVLPSGSTVNVPGVLGVETDQDLIPPDFRALDGDRVAAFGRLIVDAGHDDFHTELHPPLLLATARSLSPDETFCSLIARPYLVSQDFGDGSLRSHLIKEIERIATIIGPLPPVIDSFPVITEQIEARPRLKSKPFKGIVLAKMILRPAAGRQSAKDRLVVNFHFTLREGVAIQLFDAGSDSLGMLVTMNDVNYTAPELPRKRPVNITFDDLEKLKEGLGQQIKEILGNVEGVPLVLPPLPIPGDILLRLKVEFIAAIIEKGILTDRFEAPNLPDLTSTTELPVSDLPGNTPVTLNSDPNQSFPIIGVLHLKWKRAVSSDHFYTTNAQERDHAIAEFSYEDEGIACHVFPTALPGSIPLFRLFKPEPADHFYTVSQRERDRAIAEFGYIDEGIACHVFFHVFDTPSPIGATPLFRLFNPEKGDHFYTTSSDERDRAVTEFGYQDEGIACEVFDAPAEGTVPLFRVVKVAVPGS